MPSLFINNLKFQIFPWGLGIGDWGLGVGGVGPHPKPQHPTPKPQTPKIILKNYFKKKKI